MFAMIKGKSYNTKMAAALLLGFAVSSCIDGFDSDETFTTTVKNAQLTYPELSWASSADGSQTDVTWPIVRGAGGYSFTLINVTDESNPDTLFVDKFVDGVKLSIPRAEDQFYDLTVSTVENKKYNNKGSEAHTYRVSTFVNPINEQPIATGTDLTATIQGLVAQADGSLEYGAEFGIDLEPGGEFTMSGKVDLGGYQVTLRSTNPNKPVTIAMGENAGFETESSVKFKNIIFNCDSLTNKDASILAYKSEPSFEQATDHWLIDGPKPTVFQNCRVKNLSTRMIFDNCKAWAIQTILLKRCIIQVDQEAQTNKKSTLGGTSACAVIDLANGFCYNLTIQESTIYSTSEISGTNPAVVIFEGKRSQQICNGIYNTNTVKVVNSTFVNLNKNAGSNGSMFNMTRFKGQSNSYAINQNNIFVDCCKGAVKRYAFLQGQNSNMSATFSNNCYLYGETLGEAWNTFPNPDEVSFDPQLTLDEETGIFKVGSEDVKAAGCGDPRGLE